ncbi:MAG: hypothetical protein WC438_06295, partial [Candidatus Pacearchaeota archaeon]
RFIKKIIDNIDKKENEILIRYAGDEFILLSNRINALKTNKFFSVGMSEIRTSLFKAILLADRKMLINKHIQKHENTKI